MIILGFSGEGLGQREFFIILNILNFNLCQCITCVKIKKMNNLWTS